MKDDQWFEVGDKCLRVREPDPKRDGPECCTELPPYAPWGEILCVSAFQSHPDGNTVLFHGYPAFVDENGDEWWEIPDCFRRVDEVRMCIEAAKHVKKPERVEVETV